MTELRDAVGLEERENSTLIAAGSSGDRRADNDSERSVSA
jgi:hypothetical protein